ncbi:MAG: superinfection immunity protein [Chlorobiaceae bacterium]|nr:superinfection immunity protein [Chlorobiaceae bacterium]
MEHEIIRSWAWSTPSLVPLILINVFLWAFYFVPSLIAWSRRHRSLPAIIALNVLLGWTGLGWIGAFVWALSWPGHDGSPRTPVTPEPRPAEPEQYEEEQ